MENTVFERIAYYESSSRKRFYKYLIPTLFCGYLFLVIVLKSSLKLKALGKRVDKIPGPFSLPLLGTLALIVIPRTEVLECLTKWTNKFRGCFRLWLLNKPMIFISTPEYIQKILGSKEHVDKSEAYEVTKHLFGEGLITAETSIWKAHRKLLTNSINGKMVDVFLDICNEYLDVFQSMLENNPSIASADKDLASSTLDLLPTVNRLILDIASETIIGKSQNTLKTSTSTYLEAGIKNKALCSKRFFHPWLRWKWLWAIHPLRKDEQYIVKVANEFVESTMAERQKYHKEMQTDSSHYEKCVGRGAFIDTLLDAADDPNNQITDQYIKDELLTFMVAGHDTSTETIMWNLFLLGHHLAEQEKIYAELVRIFGDSKSPRFTLDDLQNMTYLDQCMKETFRMYPSVPLLSRRIGSDVILEPDLVLPSGSDVWISVGSVHHNPEIYPNPSMFDPGRFSPENCEKRHPYAYIPFSMGPRNCIGKRIGEIGVKVVLARLLLNFSVVSVDKLEEVKPIPEVTLSPSKPILFYVKRR